jgi:hypothetical protein
LSAKASSIILLCGVLAATSSLFSSENQGAAKSTASAAAKAGALPQVWKSASTGKEYRVKVEGDRFTAEWSNIPPQAAKQGAYIRTECRRTASRWIGTTRFLLPFPCPPPNGKLKMCPLILRFEVDFISPDRITGGGESLRGFDCSTCEVKETAWRPFSWTPKSSDK